jgi:large subunit ribosomal protein L4
MKRLALRGALTAKLNDGAIRVLDTFALEQIRTKDLLGVLGNLQAGGRVLIVAPARDDKLDLSARNLSQVEVLLADSLNVVDILKADTVVIEQPALTRLEEVYA